MKTLKELIIGIGYDNGWGIWAEVPFTPDSPARLGQMQFKNGGLLDEKEFFANGEQCGDAISDWGDTPLQDMEDWMIAEGADVFIAQQESERGT